MLLLSQPNFPADTLCAYSLNKIKLKTPLVWYSTLPQRLNWQQAELAKNIFLWAIAVDRRSPIPFTKIHATVGAVREPPLRPSAQINLGFVAII
jgi:hypothetical protein